MPAITFTVRSDWDAPILPVSAGGPPHITVYFTGQHLSDLQLKNAAIRLYSTYVGRPLTLTEVKPSVFIKEDTGKTRHDILLKLDPSTSMDVKEARVEIDSMFPHIKEKFIGREPHVTVESTYDKEEFKEKFKLWTERMPIKAKIIGINIY